MDAGHRHDHDHASPLRRAGARHAGRLRAAFALALVFLVVEATAAFLAHSLALLSDAAHMLTDAVGIGLALAAIGVASRSSADGSRTFGLYRLEILAALANAVLLFGVAVYVLVTAALRLGTGPDVHAATMLVVAAVGLVVNLISVVLLRGAADESLSVAAAYLDVTADLAASTGVVVAAAAVAATGWTRADPLVALLIGLWIVPRTWRLAARSLRILLQAAPAGLDLAGLRSALASLPGVVDVHDLHVWTLTSEMEVASAHLMIAAGTDPHPVLDRARDVLRHGYSIDHATLQVEPDDHTGCAEVNW